MRANLKMWGWPLHIDKMVFEEKGRLLQTELLRRGLNSVSRRISVAEAATNGWFIVVARFSTHRLELWFDEWIDKPAFWIGVEGKSSKCLQDLISARPDTLSPRAYVTSADFDNQRGNLKRSSIVRLERQISNGDLIREDYENDEPNSEHFLGSYFTPEHFDLMAVADFCEYIVGQESPGAQRYLEGRGLSIIQTKYERDPAAREACLNAHGYSCKCCLFDFERVYGSELGRKFIHVHHKDPLANGERQVDPINDLVPVCPNCHAMLHRETPPISVEHLKLIVDQQIKRSDRK